MVLGEPQILGQMKQAVRMADEAGTLGTTLHQLFQQIHDTDAGFGTDVDSVGGIDADDVFNFNRHTVRVG